MPEKQVVRTEAAPAPFQGAPYSQAIRVGDLVFVSGNPGSTSRLYTQAQLELVRDVELPLSLEFIKRRLSVLREYSARGSEQARRAKAQVFNFENSQKALEGRLRGFLFQASSNHYRRAQGGERRRLGHDRGGPEEGGVARVR